MNTTEQQTDVTLELTRLANLWFLQGTEAHETIMKGVQEIERLRNEIVRKDIGMED